MENPIERVSDENRLIVSLAISTILSSISLAILWATGYFWESLQFPWWKGLPIEVVILAGVPYFTSCYFLLYAIIKILSGNWSSVDESAIISETSDEDPRK